MVTASQSNGFQQPSNGFKKPLIDYCIESISLRLAKTSFKIPRSANFSAIMPFFRFHQLQLGLEAAKHGFCFLLRLRTPNVLFGYRRSGSRGLK
jgi:hypothetical protein